LLRFALPGLFTCEVLVKYYTFGHQPYLFELFLTISSFLAREYATPQVPLESESDNQPLTLSAV
jgi:hypothetical protein